MANATRSYARKLTLLFRGLEARSGSVDGTAQALVCFRRSGVAIGGERDSPAALSAAAAAWGRVALWLPGIGLRGGAAATAQHGRTSRPQPEFRLPLNVSAFSRPCKLPRVPSRRTNAALTTHQHSNLVTTIRPGAALSADHVTGNGRR